MTLLAVLVAAWAALTAHGWHPRTPASRVPPPDREPGWALAQVHPRRLDPHPWATTPNHPIGEAA